MIAGLRRGARVLRAGLAAGLLATACASRELPLLTEAEDGTTVVLAVGEELRLRLESNPSTGYAWEIVDAAGGVLAAVGEPTWVPDPPDGAFVGRGGLATWHFRAVREGEGHLRLAYRRPWEKDALPARRFSARVEVR